MASVLDSVSPFLPHSGFPNPCSPCCSILLHSCVLTPFLFLASSTFSSSLLFRFTFSPCSFSVSFTPSWQPICASSFHDIPSFLPCPVIPTLPIHSSTSLVYCTSFRVILFSFFSTFAILSSPLHYIICLHFCLLFILLPSPAGFVRFALPAQAKLFITLVNAVEGYEACFAKVGISIPFLLPIQLFAESPPPLCTPGNVCWKDGQGGRSSIC